MLHIIELKILGAKKKVFKRFDPQQHIWLVSDLKSKLFLTQELLDRDGIVVGEPVKRASELWRELLQDVAPEYVSVGPIGSEFLARSFLKKQGKEAWTQRPHASQFLLNSAKALAPLLVHAEAGNILTEHFREMPESHSRWGELADLSLRFFNYCQDLRRMPAFFVPGWISHLPELPIVAPLWVDLSVHMTPGERDLIERISKNSEVSVIVPVDGIKLISKKSTLYVYVPMGLGMAAFGHEEIGESHGPDHFDNKLILGRGSNPDSEVRWAVGLIAKWVKQGTKASEICVTAPDVSLYLPSLYKDLAWEGLGVRKARAGTWIATPFFRALSARLQMVAGSLSSDLLQEGFFHNKDFEYQMGRARLQKLIRPIQNPEQIYDDRLRRQVDNLRTLRPSGLLRQAEFEKLLLDLFGRLLMDLAYSEDQRDLLKRVVIQALQALRTELGMGELGLSDWIQAFELFLRKQEQPIHAADLDGIHAIDLDSVEEAPAKKVIVLGLTEGSESGTDLAFLSEKDLDRLNMLGFEIQKSKADKLELMLQWVLSGNWDQVAFSAPANDANGKPVAAHRLWIEKALKKGRPLDILDSPEGLEWQRVQREAFKRSAELDQIKAWPTGWAAGIGDRVRAEHKKETLVLVPDLDFSKLSASRVEDFFRCPFIYLAKAIFSLTDEPEIDMEPSPQDRGRWLHEAVEKLLASDTPLEKWDAVPLEALLDGTVDMERIGDPAFWPAHRRRFVRQLKRFVDHELEWRARHPGAQPTAFEKLVEGYIGWGDKPGELQWAKTKEEMHMPKTLRFRGQVDRIDVDKASKHAAIIDYKNSGSGLKNIDKWAGTGDFQLAMYTRALEAGLTDLGALTVVAAVYYALKKLDRNTGFRVNLPEAASLADFDSNKKGIVESFKKRDEYLREVEMKIWDSLNNISTGVFTPVPFDEKDCLTCNWRVLCRATHLS